MRDRISWDEHYLLEALEFAQRRSSDSQTHHGCVIVGPRHKIIGKGCNGFPHSMDDSVLPDTRPDKYPYMVHAELNAILNCVTPPSLVPGQKTAYITGEPCIECAKSLWQAEVYRWVIANRHGTFAEDSVIKDAKDKLIAMMKEKGLQIVYLDIPKIG